MTGPAAIRRASSVVEVVAGVIQRPDGSYLLGQRPPGKPYAGYWEFPGGKVEAGEPLRSALERELLEELGIRVRRTYPWITRVFSYPHATVRLNFFRITAWDGVPHPKEGQALAWQAPGRAAAAPMLPANGPVLASLALPTLYAITDAARLGTAAMLEKLERGLEGGLRLLQIREPALPASVVQLFSENVIGRAQRYGCKVLTKAPFPGADGIHLTAADLMALERRPDVSLLAASCHNRAELDRAMALELDFVVLGPVREKLDRPTLGWRRFAEITKGVTLPVYAIGGLAPTDLEDAWQAGAHGIAMVRAAWN